MKTIIKGYLQIGATQKSEQFEKFLNRVFNLTSDTMWNGEVISAKEGFYFTLENARSKFQVFVNCNGQVERKPRNLTNAKKYTIKGQDTEVTQIY
jgi:hypothetical protein